MRTNRKTIKNILKMGKQLYGYFKQQIAKIAYEMIWIWLRKGNLKKETECLLIIAQNNTITTNYVKSKIDIAQQNNKCRLYGDRDETINLKQMQQTNIKGVQDEARLSGKDELAKRLEFDHL